MEQSPAGRSQTPLIAAIIFAGLVIAGSIIFFSYQKTKNPLAELIRQNPQLAAILEGNKKEEDELSQFPYERIVDNDPFLGQKDAPVTVVEFSDYQCPFCRRHFFQTLPSIKTNFIDTGKIRYVFRDFPLSFHPDAPVAAYSTECAREQKGDEGYFAFHDEIFKAEQTRGSGTVDIPIEEIKSHAKTLDLDETAFNTCLDSEKYKAEVDADIADGAAFGVDGTPGFILTNGTTTRRMSGAQDYSEFEAEINALLE